MARLAHRAFRRSSAMPSHVQWCLGTLGTTLLAQDPRHAKDISRICSKLLQVGTAASSEARPSDCPRDPELMYEVSRALVKVFESQPVLLGRQSGAVHLLCGNVQERYSDSPEVRAWHVQRGCADCCRVPPEDRIFALPIRMYRLLSCWEFCNAVALVLVPPIEYASVSLLLWPGM